MQEYKYNKTIQAEPCTVGEYNRIRPLFYSGECQDGYKIIDANDCISWIPKGVFEKDYNLIK